MAFLGFSPQLPPVNVPTSGGGGFLGDLGRVLVREAPNIIGAVGNIFATREARKLVEAQSGAIAQLQARQALAQPPALVGAAGFAPTRPSETIFGGAGMPSALPGGAPIGLTFPTVLGGAAAAGAGAGAIVRQLMGGGCGGPLFRSTSVSCRPMPLVMAENPVTGAPTFFRHVGRPVLFSGDVAHCKRVDKIARRAMRGRGRR